MSEETIKALNDYLPDHVKREMNRLEEQRKAQSEADELKKQEIEAAHCQHLEEEKRKEEIKLRDQFAMAALSGMLAYSYCNPRTGNYNENCSEEGVANTAYRYADAMLQARKK